MADTVFTDKYDLSHFLNLKYTHTFVKSKRKGIYYGQFPYKYGYIYHPALQIPEDSPVKDMFDEISHKFKINFNSVMVQYYPTSSTLPTHSDDEPCIHENSWILSLSLGATSTLTIKTKSHVGHNPHVYNCTLKHGDILLMTKNSQYHYNHGIEHKLTSPRISLTLRNITQI